jgi:neopullulanase
MTVPGAPNIYYGDEIGMVGGHDPGCRGSFPWFEESGWNHQLRSEVHRYIALRHELPALRRGDFRILYVAENVIVYQREYQGRKAVVAFNTGFEIETFSCPSQIPAALPEKLVEKGEPLAGGSEVRLEARSGRVWAD